ncbi:MAG: hypothetical protein MJ000_11140 [Bacteroidales bacterium]|nr:hypothetical protein [Bacteroidales bacterium]
MADCSKTEDYFNEMFRRRKAECPNKPFAVVIYTNEFDVNESIENMQKWSDEHPVKSFLDDFKEKHPNAILSCKGKPKACRRLLYGGECREDRDCLTCWKEEMT